MRWLIGDVHGMVRPLETILRQIQSVDRQSVLYFVGDYVNRGRHTREVIELLLDLDNAKFIRGNHDDVLDQILHGAAYAENDSRGDRFLAFQWFLEHGLLETLQSYGATNEQVARVISYRTRDALEAIIDLFPIEHRMFIRSLPVFIEDEDLFVVHGKWPLKESATPRQILSGGLPNLPLRQEMLWGRFSDAELHRPKAWPKTGFFGHTPIPTYRGFETSTSPIVAAKMILLDTAAALLPTGRLTAICAETSEVVQATPGGKLVTTSIDTLTA